MNLKDLNFSIGVYLALQRAGINTKEELEMKNENDLLKIRHIGNKRLQEIKDKLDSL